MATRTRSSIFYRNQKWDRLRVLGYIDRRTSLASSKLTFSPLHQRTPAFGPDDVDYQDDIETQLKSDHNTLDYPLCELRTPWFTCNMIEIDSVTLGNRVKYLLRCSSDGFPGLLADTQSAVDLYFPSEEERQQQIKLSQDQITILDIQAYDGKIALAGVNVGNPAYWPSGHQVWETKYNDEYFGEYSMWEAEDIFLPANIKNSQLGKYILRVWLARMKPPYPPPPELQEFWKRIAD